MGSQPYISIIVVSRNDDYAGGMAPRLQFSLDMLADQMNRYKIESEIILVDWNYNEKRPRLKDALDWSWKSDYCTLRVIEVAPRFHRKYRHWKKRAVHHAVSINTGMKRARGLFCVNRGSDIIWSEEVVNFISHKKLQDNKLYRCNRVDTSDKVLNLNIKDHGVSEIISHCQASVIQIHGLPYLPDDLPQLHTNASGDFQLMTKDLMHKLRGYLETKDIVSLDADSLLSFCIYATGVKEKRLPESHCVYKLFHGWMNNARIGVYVPLVIRGLRRLGFAKDDFRYAELTYDKVLYEKTDDCLFDSLEKNFYGGHGPDSILRRRNGAIEFNPGHINDHISTPIERLVPKSRGGGNWLRARLRFSGGQNPGSNFHVYMQDETCTQPFKEITWPKVAGIGIPEKDFVVFARIPETAAGIRLVITTTDAKPCIFPESIRIEQSRGNLITFFRQWLSGKLIGCYTGLFPDSTRENREIDGAKLPPYSDSLNLARKIVKDETSYVLNNEDWGLGNEELPEFYIKKAKWERN